MLRTRSLTTIGAVTLALAAPAGAVAQQDLRSPDARDASRSGEVRQDLRSPDARDAGTFDIRPSEPVPVVDTSSVDDGFEWGHAGIGGAATLALVLAVGGLAMIVARRRVGTPFMH
jgi:hypothetical protein